MANLGLGTVQLGLPYGNNSSGTLMPVATAHEIIRCALDNGITFLDTAQAYGESEDRIGSFGLTDGGRSYEVSTKIPRVEQHVWSNEKKYLKFLIETCELSRQKLRRPTLGLLQFHQCDVDFLTSPAVKSAVAQLVQRGDCESIGISVYELEQAFAALELPSLSAIQAPINVIDTRFLDQSLVSKLKETNVRLLCRSIFMQGILLPDADLPSVRKRDDLRELRRRYLDTLRGTDPLVACIGFILKNNSRIIDIAIMGVDSVESLKANLAASKMATSRQDELKFDGIESVRAFAIEKNLINPATWNV